MIEAVRSQLELLARQLDAESLERPEETGMEKQQLKRQAEAAERKLEQCRKAGSSLYPDKATGLLTEEECKELFEENRDQRAALEACLKELQA